MGFILSIYSEEAFKEYLLPAVVDDTYSIVLERDIFGLDKDIKLSMEISGGYQWFFMPSEEYQIGQLLEDKSCIPYTGQKLAQDDLFLLHLADGRHLSVMVEITDTTFAVFEKFVLRTDQTVRIGSTDANDIQYNRRKLVSGDQASIYQKDGRFVIDVKEMSNGIYINYKRVVGKRRLDFGDHINIFGLDIIYLDQVIAVNAARRDVKVRQESFQKYEIQRTAPAGFRAEKRREPGLFHRSPRQLYKPDDEPVEIEAPPAPKELNRRPLFMVIGPSLTMTLPMLMGCGLSIYSARIRGTGSGAFMYTGIVTAVMSAIIAVMWALINLNYEKKNVRNHEAQRIEAYGQYLDTCEQLIREKYEKNAAGMRSMYLSAAECSQYDRDTLSLWNRNPEHKDFLTYRLGIGNIPFQVEVRIPKERFTLVNDELAKKPGKIQEKYRMLHDVPVCVDLREHSIVGVIGGAKKRGAVEVMHNLAMQIAAAVCYTDVKMAFIYNEGIDTNSSWEYLKWFPHTWSENKKTRYAARNKADAGDILYEITQVLRLRAEQQAADPIPHYILFVAAPEMLEGELITTYIYGQGKNYGLTTVFLAESYEDLPNNCDYIIQNDEEFQGIYHVDDNVDERVRIRFDVLTDMELEQSARTLADIRINERETGGEIPSALTFFEMYHVSSLEELNVPDRWHRNRTYDSMKVLIGEKAGGTPWCLDIHEKYHGPHGLIAGTTGSGKSETLQTYILSLALNFSPDDVGFFIIDYKGGGMANLFEKLPHMMGQISNLSGNQVKRAMLSIKSENRRRQRIFNENGVNNINSYTRLYKSREASEPVPHIFIIIDEFAELKREEPDFMRELISVAQVGRSLGVHLILATQKPNGTVDDNIWSNSKFRLCLRVQDKQDSNDMLHKPDAAYITQAGRCYMQVGNDEIYELFQSGWSGAVYDEGSGSRKTAVVNMISLTGRAALIGNRTMARQKEEAKKAWIAQLLRFAAPAAELFDQMLTEFFADFFADLQREGIDYPYTEYNSQRVRDLIKAYREIHGDSMEYGQAAEKILAYAAQQKLKLPEQKEKTQLDAVIDYLGEAAEQGGYRYNLQLWLPVLPTALYLHQLKGFKEVFDGCRWQNDNRAADWNIEVPIGMYDDPVNQMQDTLNISLSQNGHHAVVGTVVSGKSTFLQTLVYALVMKYTPQEINIYAIDYSAKMLSAFEGFPHIGGVISENEGEKLTRFFGMMGRMLEERKKLLQGGNYSQYMRAQHGHAQHFHGYTGHENAGQIPAVVVVIDNYANFRTNTNDAYEDMILKLVKDGVGCGIFLVIAAGGFGSLEIPVKIADSLRTVICLEMGDRFQYVDVMHTTQIDTLPEANVKGRGIAKVGGDILEFQTAMAMEAQDAFTRMEQIQAVREQMRNAWEGKCAPRIPEIPQNPKWEEYAELDEVKQMFVDDRHLPAGYSYDDAAAYGVDLSRTYCYLIAGSSGSGKTNLLKVLLHSAARKGGNIAVIDFGGELGMTADKMGIRYIADDKAMFDFFLSSLVPAFTERTQRKKQDLQDGMSEEELYADMRQFEPVYLFVADIADFISHVNNPQEGVSDMRGFVHNVIDQGSQRNAYWFAQYHQEDSGRIAGDRIFNSFKKYRTGIHFGGNVAAQSIFNFDYVHFSEKTKTLKKGIGMLPYSEQESIAKVVVPLCKG